MGNRFCSLLLSHAAAHVAPRNNAELTLMGLLVAVSAFSLALWLLPV